MKPFTLAWLLWILAFFLIEGAAYRSGVYANMLSGHIRAVMLLNPVVAAGVLALVFWLLAHLLIDYLAVR